MIIPQLKLKKRILIVGHENNLRSIIKRLDNISETDILQLELPMAIPLIYELDDVTFKPLRPVRRVKQTPTTLSMISNSTSISQKEREEREMRELNEVSKKEQKVYDDIYKGVGVEVEMLSGRYICDPTQLKNIAKRDQQQVYDLRIKNTLETAPYLGINPITPACEKLLKNNPIPSKPKKETKEI